MLLKVVIEGSQNHGVIEVSQNHGYGDIEGIVIEGS